MIIGLSTHSPEQAQEAIRLGADYIGVGPIYPTKTKKNVCAAVTLDYLDYVVKNVTLPYVAIGGIKLNNIEEVARHGAKCICLVTEIVGAEDIGAMVEKLRTTILKGRKL
jgi:thiamine-phosphate pyrophosphorylase